MFEMSRDELIKRLERLDEDAFFSFDTNSHYYLVIVGGGALILQRYISRATHDVDVILVSPELSELLEKYDINCRVQTYINNFPYNYEDRLVLLFQGRKVDFYTASLEDIVVTKLYSSRAVDKVDVESDEVLKHLNWHLLEKLALNEDEARASALNYRNYENFKANYEEYVRKFRPCVN